MIMLSLYYVVMIVSFLRHIFIKIFSKYFKDIEVPVAFKYLLYIFDILLAREKIYLLIKGAAKFKYTAQMCYKCFPCGSYKVDCT